MNDRRCRQPLEVIKKSLEGNYREEHLFALKVRPQKVRVSLFFFEN